MTRKRADGFSLVEIMIVEGLAAALAAMSAPAITAGMRRYSLISASQQARIATAIPALVAYVQVQVTARSRALNPITLEYTTSTLSTEVRLRTR